MWVRTWSHLFPWVSLDRISFHLISEMGRFVVDQSSVDTHIAELRRQLSSAKSVFGFVNVLNKASRHSQWWFRLVTDFSLVS